MKCSEIEILLPEFISDINFELKNEIHSHLNNCNNCRNYKNEIESVFKILENKDEKYEVPNSYFNNFLPRLRENIDKKNNLILFKKPIFSFAKGIATISFIVILFITLNPKKEETNFTLENITEIEQLFANNGQDFEEIETLKILDENNSEIDYESVLDDLTIEELSEVNIY